MKKILILLVITTVWSIYSFAWAGDTVQFVISGLPQSKSRFIALDNVFPSTGEINKKCRNIGYKYCPEITFVLTANSISTSISVPKDPCPAKENLNGSANSDEGNTNTYVADMILTTYPNNIPLYERRNAFIWDFNSGEYPGAQKGDWLLSSYELAPTLDKSAPVNPTKVDLIKFSPSGNLNMDDKGVPFSYIYSVAPPEGMLQWLEDSSCNWKENSETVKNCVQFSVGTETRVRCDISGVAKD